MAIKKSKKFNGFLNFKEDRPVRSFLDMDISKLEKEYRTIEPKHIKKESEKRAFSIFQNTAKRVPAYKKFLKENGVNPKNIKSFEDFKKIPITDKNNYIKKYPLSERCVDGKLSSSRMMAMSSGTSGEPTYWPRSDEQEYEANIIHELIYKYLLKIGDKKTLVIICFPMGIYVSGIATVLPTWVNLNSKTKATFITPGNNKSEVLRAIKSLWNDFEKFVIIGHPFFVKDILENGIKDCLKWSSKDIRLLFCSEGFNEDWRNYVADLSGIKKPYYAMSTYGSSEMLLMGFETPLTVNTRIFLDKDRKGREDILPDTKVIPSIFQYDPRLRFIESVDKELIFTVNGGVPLIRFNMHDMGEVFDFDIVSKKIDSVIKKTKKDKEEIWKLPFVTLYGRSDRTLKFYAANIYPEHIRIALDHKSFLEKLTGKFVMCKKINEKMEQCLEINVEMVPNIQDNGELNSEIKKVITDKLKEINKEYLCIFEQYKDKDLSPEVKLCEFGDEKYFKPGLKPRFIID